MKKLTLAKTWQECLRMWKWIDKQIEKDKDLYAGDLKWQWLRENSIGTLHMGCFFCEYDLRESGEDHCISCPGKLINKRFECERVTYCWADKPRKFYQKLLQLNAKRKAKAAGSKT